AREESVGISAEIARLDEVVRLISSAPAPAAAPEVAPKAPAMGTVAIPAVKRPAPEAKAAPAPIPEPMPELDVTDADDQPAPRSGKGAKAPKDSSRTLFFPSGKGAEKGIDELDFLKSVGGGVVEKKGGSTKPAEAVKHAAALKEPEPVAAAKPESVKIDAGAGKTLKCAECGTMNRPTEWYCERCGAELAAL
ncbi:MAG: zinc finger Ran-binding domain-containing protein, partial [Gemmatimonadales bacterium]